MPERSTDKLLDTLITNVSNLTNSVNDLVAIDRVRVEKDKHQEEKNDAYEQFIKEATPVLNRAKDSHAMWDKAKPAIIVILIVGFLTMAGVNFDGK